MWGNCKRKVYVALDYHLQKGGHQHRAHGHPVSVNVTWSIGKNGVVVNILSHDSEDRKLVDGFEGKGSYVKNDLYLGQEWAVSRKISDISIVSAHCEHFIKYECEGSLLFRPDDPTGWWVSSNGIQLLYWKGGGGVSLSSWFPKVRMGGYIPKHMCR